MPKPRERGGGIRPGRAHPAPETCPSWHGDALAQSGTLCLSDLLPFNPFPGFGGETWGKPPSWVTKRPSPPLPQDGAGQGRPHLTRRYSKGSSSFLGKDPLETKHVPVSQCQPRGTDPSAVAWGHPQPHGRWSQVSGWCGGQSHTQAPHRNPAALPALNWAAGDRGCGLWHTSLPPSACLVRSDQKEDQSALRSLSRFN